MSLRQGVEWSEAAIYMFDIRAIYMFDIRVRKFFYKKKKNMKIKKIKCLTIPFTSTIKTTYTNAATAEISSFFLTQMDMDRSYKNCTNRASNI